jgi:hypothetical protein
MTNSSLNSGNKIEGQESIASLLLHGLQSIVGFILGKTLFRGLESGAKQFANQGLHAVENDDVPTKNGAL